MTKRVLNVPEITKKVPMKLSVQPPWSHGVRAGDFLFTAGMAALDEGGKVVGVGDVRSQTKQTLENLEKVLAAGGARFQDIIKITIFIRHAQDYPAMNEVRSQFLRERFVEGDFPASTCVTAPVQGDDLLVEMEAVAYLPLG